MPLLSLHEQVNDQTVHQPIDSVTHIRQTQINELRKLVIEKGKNKELAITVGLFLMNKTDAEVDKFYQEVQF